MTIFKSPPLVELVAEIRWGAPILGLVAGGTGGIAIPTQALQAGQPTTFQFSFANTYEDFYARFNAEAAKRGFTLQERIVPPNVMTAPFQAVWRWKRPETTNLYFQLGAGVFTINGGPPDYSSWDEFLPTVREGIDSLLAALDGYPNGRPQAVNQTLLRYIDLFDAKLTEGRLPIAFLGEVMGLKIQLPEVIEEISNGQPITPLLNLTVPVTDGAMQLVFGHGIVAGKQGNIFDSSIARTSEVALSTDAVAEALTNLHAITNKLFMALTKPLHKTMEPLE